MRTVHGRLGAWAGRYTRMRMLKWPLAWFAVMLAVAPWAFLRPVLTLDGYSHAYNTFVLRQVIINSDPAFRKYVQVASLSLPNWSASVLLAGLQSLLGIEFGLMILHSIVTLFTLWALILLLRQANPDRRLSPELLILALPLASSAFVALGFHGFAIGAAISFLVMTLLLHYSLQPPLRIQVLLALLILLIYWSHPAPFVITFLFVAAYGAVALVTGRRGLSESAWVRKFLGWLPLWAAPCAMAVMFAVRNAEPGDRSVWMNVGDNVKRGIGIILEPRALLELAPSSVPGMLFLAAWVLIAASVFVIRWNRLHRNTIGTAVFGTLLIMIYLLIPEVSTGGSLLKQRVLYYVLVCLLLVVAADERTRSILALCAWGLILPYLAGVLFYFWSSSVFLRPAMKELSRATAGIPYASKVLVLSYQLTPEACTRPTPLTRAKPERHFAALAIAQRGGFVVNNYEAHTKHFPLVARYRLPKCLLDEYSESNSACWFDFLRRDPAGIDMILLWGVPTIRNSPARHEIDPAIEAQIRQRFRLLAASDGLSVVALYGRVAALK